MWREPRWEVGREERWEVGREVRWKERWEVWREVRWKERRKMRREMRREKWREMRREMRREKWREVRREMWREERTNRANRNSRAKWNLETRRCCKDDTINPDFVGFTNVTGNCRVRRICCLCGGETKIHQRSDEDASIRAVGVRKGSEGKATASILCHQLLRLCIASQEPSVSSTLVQRYHRPLFASLIANSVIRRNPCCRRNCHNSSTSLQNIDNRSHRERN
jgi:hypothetical protein